MVHPCCCCVPLTLPLLPTGSGRPGSGDDSDDDFDDDTPPRTPVEPALSESAGLLFGMAATGAASAAASAAAAAGGGDEGGEGAAAAAPGSCKRSRQQRQGPATPAGEVAAALTGLQGLFLGCRSNSTPSDGHRRMKCGTCMVEHRVA